MSGRSELTYLEDGDWVDFPATPELAPWEVLLEQADGHAAGVSHGNASRAACEASMKTSAAMALRGLLVTTAAVATVAYLLLTNSHI